MTTLDFHQSAPRPIPIRFEDESGAVITDMQFQIRIGVGSACQSFDGALSGDEYLFDLSAADLARRVHLARIYMDDGSGWAYLSEFNLNVKGGC